MIILTTEGEVIKKQYGEGLCGVGITEVTLDFKDAQSVFRNDPDGTWFANILMLRMDPAPKPRSPCPPDIDPAVWVRAYDAAIKKASCDVRNATISRVISIVKVHGAEKLISELESLITPNLLEKKAKNGE